MWSKSSTTNAFFSRSAVSGRRQKSPTPVFSAESKVPVAHANDVAAGGASASEPSPGDGMEAAPQDSVGGHKRPLYQSLLLTLTH